MCCERVHATNLGTADGEASRVDAQMYRRLAVPVRGPAAIPGVLRFASPSRAGPLSGPA